MLSLAATVAGLADSSHTAQRVGPGRPRPLRPGRARRSGPGRRRRGSQQPARRRGGRADRRMPCHPGQPPHAHQAARHPRRGDWVEQPSNLPLGTAAHEQGRIAAENAIGGDWVFAGSLGTQVVKVFDLAAARTGLRHQDAAEAGFDAVTVRLDLSYAPPFATLGRHPVRRPCLGHICTGLLTASDGRNRPGTSGAGCGSAGVSCHQNQTVAAAPAIRPMSSSAASAGRGTREGRQACRAPRARRRCPIAEPGEPALVPGRPGTVPGRPGPDAARREGCAVGRPHSQWGG